MRKLIRLIILATAVNLICSSFVFAQAVENKIISPEELNALLAVLKKAKQAHFDTKHVSARVTASTDKITVILHQKAFTQGDVIKMPAHGTASCLAYDVLRDGSLVKQACYEK
ncbi:hypothetical protein AEAC466_13565 [Asticcacaulis sp. AC466]|uniref:hypothetical protein n=1 Tax=Asticcacaulis sp. AC466 TaxID=1282362 RepID=UPI0003C40BA1|nr:hypothetical protein [Asticcacaulis sp. AC466]ESQ83274.1 hypothetical protein AEAC466_13565 [Asticcacaulis sp. AC466]